MDDLTRKEIDDILCDPEYDQANLQDWFKSRYGISWSEHWRRYLETGEVA